MQKPSSQDHRACKSQLIPPTLAAAWHSFFGGCLFEKELAKALGIKVCRAEEVIKSWFLLLGTVWLVD